VDIVTLDEARRRLSQGAGAPHFISFTIDGAMRGVLTSALPVLKKHNVPFTLFVSPVQHDEKLLPWWLALEALVHRTPRLSLAVRGQVFRAACHRPEEKAEALDNLIPLLMAHPEPAVRRSIQAVCEADGVDLDAIAGEMLLDWAEIRGLAQDPLVTIGQLASECHGAGASAYDSVRESLRRDRARLGEAVGKGIRHIGFSAGWSGLVEDRDLEIVTALGFSSASLPEGGVAIAGGASRCAVLPRLCLSNAPYVLLEAQGLAGAGFNLNGRKTLRAVAAA
jgi:peptidoglycan/xylan/chitin deacetylase (PgdA/CDA1 family)